MATTSAHASSTCRAAARRRQAKTRHWTREETVNLISVWAEPRYQRQFESLVHNHTVWEKIYEELVRRCPSVHDFGDWAKMKDRMDYLKRKYRECLKNKKTGSTPSRCPYYEELDAVLGCRPMNNPGDHRLDRGSSEEEENEESSGESPSGHQLGEDGTEGVEDEVAEDEPAVDEPSIAEPDPQAQRRRKGRKTQMMEALEKGLDRLCQHDYAYERERLEWEEVVERKRMELENKRLEFEMKRMEADEHRSRDNRDLMAQLFQCIRPPAPFSYMAPHMAPHPFPPPHQGTSTECYPTAPEPPCSSSTPGPIL
ncbi:uncharacterized protein LOC132873439 isoform X2 [Neoarius graeffei]|uniref:uncharacterized protein LOC132873439 isoform X2 n=1 Tax=Neoarius graeffei TaxID=443677 RepID=UPI00298C3718|nr:uncharacterized protein LOC132873439 isoform X2 [Neoarius graeffei]